MADREDIARHAYRLWENHGRPEGRDLEFWLAAEAGAQRANALTLTNLDRALPPAERSRVRAERRGGSPQRAIAPPPDHFMAVIDRAHLRIYRVREPATGGSTQFELAEAFDLIAGHQQYTDRDTDQAGRFPGAQGRGGGGSIDERLPMQTEQERRLAAELAGHLQRFFGMHADATWDYAAGPAIHHAVLDRLPPAIRGRLGVTLVKELAHQTPAQLRAHLGW